MTKRVRATANSGEPKKARWTQLALDVGQHDVSATNCQSCGMVYTAGLDNEAHRRYHCAVLEGIVRFPLSASRSCGIPALSRQDGLVLYVIDKRSSRAARSAAELAGNVAAAELNALPITSEMDVQVVLGVRDSIIIGYCAFERVNTASVGAVYSDGLVRCGRSIERAMCGVRIIWVKSGVRRQSIATDLVNTARCSLAYAHVYSRSHVAFSPPTPNGAQFAVRFAPQRVRRQKFTSFPNQASEMQDTKQLRVKEPKSENGHGKSITNSLINTEIIGYILVYKPFGGTDTAPETASL